MPFSLMANNKHYLVDDHAAKRMLQRFISEEMIIEALERGHIIEQAHGTELFEVDRVF